MKKLTQFVISAVIVYTLLTSQVFAKSYVITESFDNGQTIEYTNTPVLNDIVADFYGDTHVEGFMFSRNYVMDHIIDADGEIISNVIVKTWHRLADPKILAVCPLGKQKGVFDFGQGTNANTIWEHMAGLVYDFDVPRNSLALTFSYLNNRSNGTGSFVFVVQEVDENENVIWEGQKPIAGYKVYNKGWKTYVLGPERFEEWAIKGHKFNRLYILEGGSTYGSKSGGGYLDDLVITTTSDEVEETREISASFISTGTTVTVTPVSKEAFYNHILYATVNGVETKLCNTADIDSPITLGPFPVGTPIDFRLHVTTVDDSFYTGDASNNPDGLDHCQMVATDLEDVWILGFEDMLNNGDADFNDCTFSVQGVSVVDGR